MPDISQSQCKDCQHWANRSGNLETHGACCYLNVITQGEFGCVKFFQRIATTNCGDSPLTLYQLDSAAFFLQQFAKIMRSCNDDEKASRVEKLSDLFKLLAFNRERKL